MKKQMRETTKQRIKRIAKEFTAENIDKALLTNELEALVLSAEIDTITSLQKL